MIIEIKLLLNKFNFLLPLSNGNVRYGSWFCWYDQCFQFAVSAHISINERYIYKWLNDKLYNKRITLNIILLMFQWNGMCPNKVFQFTFRVCGIQFHTCFPFIHYDSTSQKKTVNIFNSFDSSKDFTFSECISPDDTTKHIFHAHNERTLDEKHHMLAEKCWCSIQYIYSGWNKNSNNRKWRKQCMFQSIIPKMKLVKGIFACWQR